MCRWSMRQLAGESGSLGYPKKACGFSEKTTGGYNHSAPTAFSVEDFRDLEIALAKLQEVHNGQFMAAMMYYKPWITQSMVLDGWPFNNSTYYKRLHAAHSYLSTELDHMKAKVE